MKKLLGILVLGLLWFSTANADFEWIKTQKILSTNDIVNIDGNTTITGKLHVTEEQTNDKTIVAQGTITDSGATLASHTHPGDSGGNTGSPN